MLRLLTHTDRRLGHEPVIIEVSAKGMKSMSGPKDSTGNATAYDGLVVEHLVLEDGDLISLEGHNTNRKWIAFRQSETHHTNSSCITVYALSRSQSCVPSGFYSRPCRWVVLSRHTHLEVHDKSLHRKGSSCEYAHPDTCILDLLHQAGKSTFYWYDSTKRWYMIVDFPMYYFARLCQIADKEPVNLEAFWIYEKLERDCPRDVIVDADHTQFLEHVWSLCKSHEDRANNTAHVRYEPSSVGKDRNVRRKTSDGGKC